MERRGQNTIGSNNGKEMEREMGIEESGGKEFNKREEKGEEKARGENKGQEDKRLTIEGKQQEKNKIDSISAIFPVFKACSKANTDYLPNEPLDYLTIV